MFVACSFLVDSMPISFYDERRYSRSFQSLLLCFTLHFFVVSFILFHCFLFLFLTRYRKVANGMLQFFLSLQTSYRNAIVIVINYSVNFCVHSSHAFPRTRHCVTSLTNKYGTLRQVWVLNVLLICLITARREDVMLYGYKINIPMDITN